MTHVKFLVVFLILVVVLVLGGYQLINNGRPVKFDDKSDMIMVTTPVAGQIVTSPLTITGEARGTWYFEASFPVRIVDANGVVLGEHYATAQGEWMTEDFVPFTSQLNFSQASTATGELILTKDNPSGLPEHEEEVRIPVRFR